MTYRERIYAAVNHVRHNEVPCSYDLTRGILKKIVAHYQTEPPELFELMGEHIHNIYMDVPQEYLPNGLWRDEFGVLWRTDEDINESVGDWGLTEQALKTPSLAGYTFPDGTIPRFGHINSNELLETNRFVLFHITGVFDTCWHIRGFENFLSDMADEDVFLSQILDKAVVYLIDVINQIPEGVDGIRILEDWGMQKSMIMGPHLWRKYLKPRLKEVYAAVRKKNLVLILHSCGDIHEIMPDLVELGMQVVHPIQPEVMDLPMLKREYGSDLCFYGGMGCQSTLVFGSVKDTLAEAERLISVMAKDGGFIFGPAGAIPTDANINNVAGLIEYGKTLFSH